jgi:hypothetical protein
VSISTFLYPRVVVLSRSDPQTGVGFQPGYSAELKTDELLIQAGIPASIQLNQRGQAAAVGLPTETTDTLWNVLIPLQALAKGMVRQGDTITDDEGDDYQVIAPYWDSLGFNLLVKHLSV